MKQENVYVGEGGRRKWPRKKKERDIEGKRRKKE